MFSATLWRLDSSVDWMSLAAFPIWTKFLLPLSMIAMLPESELILEPDQASTLLLHLLSETWWSRRTLKNQAADTRSWHREQSYWWHNTETRFRVCWRLRGWLCHMIDDDDGCCSVSRDDDHDIPVSDTAAAQYHRTQHHNTALDTTQPSSAQLGVWYQTLTSSTGWLTILPQLQQCRQHFNCRNYFTKPHILTFYTPFYTR